jgi:hypothetical protein
VRYCLADPFLVVKASDLRRKVAAILGDLPPVRALETADWLIASGGEAFWKQQLLDGLGGPGQTEIVARLEAGGVLETAGRWSGEPLLHLARPWLQKI